jgi:hypothetical protein
VQVGQRAGAHVAPQQTAGERRGGELRGEDGHDHVGDRGAQRRPNEASAHAVGREVAAAVCLHARLFEQCAVTGELPLHRVFRVAQRLVVVGDPALGVLGVHHLVQPGSLTTTVFSQRSTRAV